MRNRVRSSIFAVLGCLCTAGHAWAEPECGAGPGHRDYYSGEAEDRRKLRQIEGYHFNENVRNLVKGQTTTHPAGDLIFMLDIFPNHTMALEAMVRLADKHKTDTPPGSEHSVTCYLERAVYFRPEDAAARVLFGVHLAKRGKTDAAIEQLTLAEKARPNDPNVHYNLGLMYFDKKNYDKALIHARRAYQLGFPLPGLKRKLTSVGKWSEG